MCLKLPAADMPLGAFVPPSSTPFSVSARAAMPRGVWVLGLVSLLMDVSSELAHSLLPLFLAGTLGCRCWPSA